MILIILSIFLIPVLSDEDVVALTVECYNLSSGKLWILCFFDEGWFVKKKIRIICSFLEHHSTHTHTHTHTRLEGGQAPHTHTRVEG
jgi:hypothetical protein